MHSYASSSCNLVKLTLVGVDYPQLHHTLRPSVADDHDDDEEEYKRKNRHHVATYD